MRRLKNRYNSGLSKTALLYRLLFIILICCPTDSDCQKEDHQWIFNWSRIDSCDLFSTIGEDCGASVLDFNSLPPRGYRNESITLDMGETNASICGPNGELLYYSNGMTIHSGTHEPVINGDTISYVSGWHTLTWSNENGEPRSSGHRYIQSIGFFPKPGAKDTVYVLYQNYTSLTTTGYIDLQYGTLFLNEENEYKLVNKDVSINNRIHDPGNVHACKHANGRDWWLLQFSKDTVYSYLIDPNGIKLDHLQFLPFKLRSGNGPSKFNAQGDAFALYHRVEVGSLEGADLMIAYFDRCTGELYEPLYKKLSSLNISLDIGLEFSPSGELLYISEPRQIIQIDMNEFPQINFSTIAEFPIELCEFTMFHHKRFGQLRRAPDNKIYIARTTQCFDIHVINHPDIKGEQCDVQRDVIKLPTYTDGTIPNFNTYRLGPLDGSACDTLGLDNHPVSRFWYEQDSSDFLMVQLWDVSYFRPESWRWTFGDGRLSSDRHPVHTYDEKGIYEVCLTVSNDNSSNSSCQTINLGMVSTSEITTEIDVSVFPNPFQDILRVTLHDYLPGKGRIVIYNLAGQKVTEEKVIGGANNINLDFLPAGTYLYELLDEAKVIKTGKVIKL